MIWKHLWFLSLFLFGLLTHWKYVRTLSATNPLLLCCVALLRKKFRLEARDSGNNPQKILPKSPKIIPKFFPSGTKMPALGSVGGVRNRKMWSVFCRNTFIFCRKNSSMLQNELWSNLIAVCRNQSGPFLPLMSNHTNAYKCYRFRVPYCLIETSCFFSLNIYLVLNRYPRFSPDTFSSLSRYTPIHPTQIHVVLYTFALIQRLF